MRKTFLTIAAAALLGSAVVAPVQGHEAGPGETHCEWVVSMKKKQQSGELTINGGLDKASGKFSLKGVVNAKTEVNTPEGRRAVRKACPVKGKFVLRLYVNDRQQGKAIKLNLTGRPDPETGKYSASKSFARAYKKRVKAGDKAEYLLTGEISVQGTKIARVHESDQIRHTGFTTRVRIR